MGRPCRSCLATFAERQEEYILFAYDPYAGLAPYPSPGPDFIPEDCANWEAETFPPTLRPLPMTFDNYGGARWTVARERVANGEVEVAFEERLFAEPAVRYLHVRNAEAGCFIARVERVG